VNDSQFQPTTAEWIDHLRKFVTQESNPLGTVRYADQPARRRGLQAVKSGDAISLARTIPADFSDGISTYSLNAYAHQTGPVVTYRDEMLVGCHGPALTHIDALCHVGVNGMFFGGVEEGRAPTALSVENWGPEGIVTRAVLLDLPEVHETDWIEIDRPVTAADLDAALERAGGRLDPGDGVLIYMGRDRFEAAGNIYKTTAASHQGGRPGLGRSGAEWLAERKVSVLCWDFLDACCTSDPPYCIHVLIWAVGLALVDSCRLEEVRRRLQGRQHREGMLVVAPLRLEGSTGCLVNPLLLV